MATSNQTDQATGWEHGPFPIGQRVAAPGGVVGTVIGYVGPPWAIVRVDPYGAEEIYRIEALEAVS